METSNNIIVFPKENKNLQSQKTVEEINHNMELMKHYHIQETIANIIPLIFNQLEIAGFHVSEKDDNDLKDGAFIVESLRSIMCKYHGIYHPFQMIANSIFTPDPDEEGALKVVDSINISLTKKNGTEGENKT